MASTKSNVMFPCSDDFKAAIDAVATKLNMSRSALIREAIALHIKYDLKKEPKGSRVKKYESLEARMEAQKARDKRKRELTRELIQAVERGEREEDIKALAESIKTRIN